MSRILAGLGWLVFAAIVLLGGQMMLGACEVGTWPLLGYAYCPVPPRHDRDASDSERQRTRVLQSRIRRAELQLAALPVCQPPPPPLPPEPEKHAEVPPPPPPQPDQMKMPATLAELKGCWVSERGDLPLVSDDEEQRPGGRVRVCYCFGDNGRGQIILAYTDGRVCRGGMSSTLEPLLLTIRQPRFACGVYGGFRRGLVKSITTCRPSANNVALCQTQNLGRMRTLSGEKKFQRIDSSQCGSQG